MEAKRVGWIAIAGLMMVAATASAQVKLAAAKVSGLVTAKPFGPGGEDRKTIALMGAHLKWTHQGTGETFIATTAAPQAQPAVRDGVSDREQDIAPGEHGPANYWIKSMAPGRYSLRISARGYYPLMVAHVVVKPGHQDMDFGPLEPLARPQPPVSNLPPPATDSTDAEDPLAGSGAAPQVKMKALDAEGATGDAPTGYSGQFRYWQQPPPGYCPKNAYITTVFLVQNTGSNAWKWGYGSPKVWINFVGTGFTMTQVLPYTATVGPNGQLSIRVTLRAPNYSGNHRVQFAITCNGGAMFYTPAVYVRV